MKKTKCDHCAAQPKEMHLIVVAHTQAHLCNTCYDKWYRVRDSEVRKLYLDFVGKEVHAPASTPNR